MSGDKKTRKKKFKEGLKGSVQGRLEKKTGRTAASRKAPRVGEDWFRRIYSDSPIAIELFDADGLLIDVNNACLKLFGVKDAGEVRGFKLFEDPNISAKVKKRLLEGKTVRYEAPFDFGKVREAGLYKTRKSGVIHLDVLITPVSLKAKSNASGYLVQVQDVTKRAKVEEALRKSEDSLREKVAERTAELLREVAERGRAEAEISSIYNAISDYLTVVDTDYKIMSYNKIVEKQFGGNLRGKFCYEAYQARKGVCPGCAVSKCIESGKTEYTFQPATTVSKPVEIFAYPIFDEKGRVTAVVEHGRDVTEKLGMHAERERLLKAVSSSSEGIAIADEEDRYLFVNEAHARIFACRPDDLIGKTWREFVHPELLGQTEKAVLTTLHNPEVGEFHAEFPALRKDGSTIPIEVRGRALWDGRGNYQGHICVVSDITERKKAEEALKEREERFRKVFDEGPLGMASLNLEGRFLNANAVFCGMMGYSKQELQGMTFRDISHPERAELDRELVRQLFSGEIPFIKVEKRYVRKDGEVFWGSVTASVIRDDTGKPLYTISMVEDITTRKKAEEALQRSEQRYSSFVRNFQGIAFRGGMDFVPEFFHGAVEEITGYTENDFLSGIPRWDQVIHEDDLPAVLEKGSKLVEGPHVSINREYRIVRKDGGTRWVRESIHNVCDSSGKPVFLEGAIYDITERKKAEESLRLFSEALEAAPDCIQIVDPEGKIIYSNKAIEEIFGYSREELIGLHVNELNADADFASRVIIPAIKSAGRWEGEVIVRRKDGREFPIWLTTSMVTNDRGEPVAMIGASRDISERKRMEEELKGLNARLTALIEALPDPVMFKDAQGRHLLINRACEKTFHLKKEDVLGRAVEEFLPPAVAAHCRKSDDEAANSSAPQRAEEQVGDGPEILWLDTIKSPIRDDSGNVLGLVAVSRDITERKRMEAQLRESLGAKETLIKEVHHRVKNNLAVISSLLRLQSREIKDKRARDLFDESRNRVSAMSYIHEKLYHSTDLTSLDFREYITEMANKLFRSFEPRQEISLSFDIAPAKLDIDTVIPCALIVNELVTNALKHAFPEDRKGVLVVSLQTEGDGVYTLAVRDDGVGFPKGLDFSKTSTLGMQIVNSLCAQLGATVELQREGGTEFRVTFEEKRFNK